MSLDNILKKMSNITRWSHCYCNKPESVLEHTAVVSFLCLNIGKQLNADLSILLSAAILHDIEEIITGDIPTPTKYHNDAIEQSLKEFEDTSAREICGTLGVWAYPIWRDAKDETLEGEILRVADTIAVLLKIEIEIELGNLSFSNYIQNCYNAFTKHYNDVESEMLKDLINYYMEYIYDNYRELCKINRKDGLQKRGVEN